jgi:glutamate dehydrogenase
MAGGVLMLASNQADREAILDEVGRCAAGAQGAMAAGSFLPAQGRDSYAHGYLRSLAADDLREQAPEVYAGLAMSHLATAMVREPGTAVVRVFTPDNDQDGWSTGHTAIEIVTDDVPFLVDSVNGELARLGCEIHLVIHPQVAVRRDLSGKLLEILAWTGGAPHDGPPAALPRDAGVESWIHVEIGRESSPDRRDEIAAGLRRVLEDVRVAVEDWDRMRQTAERIAAELQDAPPSGLGQAEVAEGAALLHWMADGHFTFLGYREYDLAGQDGEETLDGRPGTGLGILRNDQLVREGASRRLSPNARKVARDRTLLVLTKANSRATVHRTGYLDYIGVKVFGPGGEVTGERRFIGLFASSAYTGSVLEIPVVRRTVGAVLDTAGFSPESHSGKDLLQILETYPRDELFEISVPDLSEISISVMQLQERRRTRLFIRPDVYGRFVSCLVYLPRDRFTTAIRTTVTAILRTAVGGVSVDFTAMVSQSVLARLHLVIRVRPGGGLPDLDVPALEARVAHATRSWEEDFREAAIAALGEEAATALVRDWAEGIPESYRAVTLPSDAVHDVCRISELLTDESQPDPERAIGLHLHEAEPATPTQRRLVLYRRAPLSLSAVLPYLSNLGVEVVDERPHTLVRRDGTAGHLYDFGLRRDAPEPGNRRSARARRLFCDAFVAAWRGQTESDGLDRLVLAAGLDWRQVGVLRAYTRYLRQAGSTFGQTYLHECLVAQAPIAALLADLFETRFDPDLPDSTAQREAQMGALADRVREALDGVPSLDQDRVLRSILGLIMATLRTNHYARDGQSPDDASARPRPCLALKLDPQAIPELPAPRPAFEIFVYSAQLEGVHLRFGAVARGGLRWSDRPEDFRTEVLGLVKAQMTKNAVIVPTGAKGGFIAKRLPDPAADREAWLAEGIACYRSFVGGLLDVTDNLVTSPGGERTVVPPPRVVRHDGDDPYLVVAADKGTAAFSDLANEVAQSYGFWLGDAFASGGSVGYDHKAMGITARGAWESVKRHFRELGHDVQVEPTTVAGVGDMSGDVFGNGMLLSPAIQLVAAFDHRHVFLDPAPDPEVSLAERVRLFALPRSSWADYDSSLISEGGGLFSRSAKSVQVSAQAARRLGIAIGPDGAPATLTPAELIQAILTAPVDLLWNGGIGTYVKASSQTHADVGDKANDAVRVNGGQVRARVIGEGGNLGLTQLGRIEAARAGVRVNTDAIDNSAGVDCSDHEVNIKILLDQIVAAGDLTRDQRNDLLAEMTADVSRLVLRDNYEQNVLLGNARLQSQDMLRVHRRFLRHLEDRGALDRALEFLPDDAALDALAQAGEGLTSPEFSVLVAYSKLTLTQDISATGLPEDPWLDRILRQYFPPALTQRFGQRLEGHPLRREIITTILVNDMVNRGGITFAFRAMEETSATAEQVTRAYIVCREIFGLDDFVASVEALDGVLPTGEQSGLYLAFRRMLDRAVRWFLYARGDAIDIAAEIERFGPVIASLTPRLPDLALGEQRAIMLAEVARLRALDVPEPLARQAAGLLTRFMLLDVTQIAQRTGAAADEVARVYLGLADRYAIVGLLHRVSQLPRGDEWQSLARASMRYDLYAAVEAMTVAVLSTTDAQAPATDRIAEYEAAHAAPVARAIQTIGDVDRLPTADLTALAVVMRSLRSIVRVTG